MPSSLGSWYAQPFSHTRRLGDTGCSSARASAPSSREATLYRMSLAFTHDAPWIAHSPSTSTNTWIRTCAAAGSTLSMYPRVKVWALVLATTIWWSSRGSKAGVAGENFIVGGIAALGVDQPAKASRDRGESSNIQL